MKKKVLYTLLCISVVGFIFGIVATNNINNKTLTTDSGWDTDYGSGGSSGSGSSYTGGSSSSGSSWDYNDRDRDSSYHRSVGRIGGYKFDATILVPVFGLMFLYMGMILSASMFDFPNKISKAFVIFQLIINIPLFVFYIIWFSQKRIQLIPEFFDWMMLLYVIASILQYRIYKNIRYNKDSGITHFDYEDISRKELEEVLPDYNLLELKMELFGTFKEIQTAWMDFEYDSIKDRTTNELYNSYKSQLKVLERKKEKNVMLFIVPSKIKIYEVKEDDKIITVNAYMKVKLKDYVIDSKKKITHGTKAIITNNYIMTFVRAKKVREYECPNCGKKVNIITTQTCPYCKSTIVVDPNKFVLSKKTNLKTERGIFF